MYFHEHILSLEVHQMLMQYVEDCKKLSYRISGINPAMIRQTQKKTRAVVGKPLYLDEVSGRAQLRSTNNKS